MVHVFRLLLLLSLSLFSGQMLAAQNQPSSEFHYTHSEKLYKLTQYDYHAIKAPYRAWNTRDSWSPDGYFRHLKRDLLGLLPCRRTSGNDGDLPLNITPDYHLLVAFLSPSLLDIALKATPLLDAADVFAYRRSYHLAGWKQANLLYVFAHSRDA
ncbi:hypothetical protein L4D18_05705 [Vibrio campbellii]